jgi:hypothetical protein
MMPEMAMLFGEKRDLDMKKDLLLIEWRPFAPKDAKQAHVRHTQPPFFCLENGESEDSRTNDPQGTLGQGDGTCREGV